MQSLMVQPVQPFVAQKVEQMVIWEFAGASRHRSPNNKTNRVITIQLYNRDDKSTTYLETLHDAHGANGVADLP